MDSVKILERCGDIQREIFYSSFLHHNKVGEMICVNDDSTGDSFIFERWRIHEIDFVACFKLLSEDSLITHGISYSYKAHEDIVREKSERQLELYTQFLEKLASEGKTLEEIKSKATAQGKDATVFDYKPYTREMLEEKLPAGKKTIVGDRFTTIEVMERQKDIPNDLQKPSLNRFTLNVSSSIQALLDLSVEDKDDMDAACKAWKEHHLLPCPRHLPISTTLPFLAKVIQVIPDIYEFPAKELHVD